MSKFKDLLHWFVQLSLKKKLLLILLLIVIVIAVYSRFSKSSSAVQYQTAQVVRGDVISTITESGNVTSSNLTSVGSPTNGVISALYVKNGDEIQAGQQLFSVKSTATPQEQAAAYASYLSAQNSLNAAKSKMNSLQAALFKANQTFINDRGVANPSDDQKKDPVYIEENANWLQAEADYNNQSGVIAAAQASYNNASLSYQQTQDATVTAPIVGTVANLSLSVGGNVAASGVSYNGTSSNSSASNSNATPVLVIGNFSNLSLKAPVSEVDLGQLKVGQKATISLDAYPDATYVGKVDSIDSIGTNSSGVVTYNAYITFISPPPTIRPGMTASAIIQLARHANVLSVPIGAVLTNANGTYVREMKNGTLTEVPVTTGLSSDTDTEIVSGLSEGETIITNVVTPVTSTNSTTGSSPFSGLNRGFGGGGAVRIGGGGGGARTTTGGATGR